MATATPARIEKPNRWRKLRSTLATASAVALLGVLPAAPPAHAADMFGHDVSWPQCAEAEGGYGLPMPPESSQFVIIGLTHGLAYTENPCVARLYKWAKDRSKPAQAYGMATYPTSAQLSAYGNTGPWTGSGIQARLANAGYQQGVQAAATLAEIGWRPSTVWIDVEPRPRQPWPSSTSRAAAANNRAVVEGYMRALKDRNYRYGFYSYTNGWKEIVGSWTVPGVPVWATAGTLDYPTEALDRCTQPSFSGGKVLISQWYNTTQDFDRTCPGYSFGTPPTPRNTELFMDKDFDSNKTNDVIARQSSTGDLYRYPGTGTGKLGTRVKVGSNWTGMGLITSVGDLSGDGIPDLVARQNSTGDLYLYRGTGAGSWQTRVKIGTAWGNVTRLSGQGDYTGDGNVDIVARTSAGYLYVYPGNGKGGFKSRIYVGSGWNVMRDIVSMGDFTGNGTADLIAMQPTTGQLWLYPGLGNGKFGTRKQIGSGWSTMTELLSPGDFNRDRRPDLLARRTTGELYLYPGAGVGTLGARTLVSTGWNSLNAID